LTHATILNLIGATTTKSGLKVTCRLDTRRYPKGVKVGADQMASIQIVPDEFHGDWNYTIRPRRKTRGN
jgi:hypothetical protein